MLLNLKHTESGERNVPGFRLALAAIDLKLHAGTGDGRNTDEVLRELLGLSDDKIATLDSKCFTLSKHD